MRTALIVPVKGAAGCWGHSLGVTRVGGCFIFNLIFISVSIPQRCGALWKVGRKHKEVRNASGLVVRRPCWSALMLINCVLFRGAVDDRGILELSSEEMEMENKSNRNRLFLNSPFRWLVENLSGEAEHVLGTRLWRLAGVTLRQVWDYVASVLRANSLKAAKMPNASLIVYFMAADVLWHYLIFL